MKPVFRKILDASGYSFSLVDESPPLFDTPWHFHPEFELIHIKNSYGKRFMGDHIANFDENELVLIGPNIPHFWQNNGKTKLSESKAFVVHFREDFLGKEFFQLPEAQNIYKLLKRAQTGLKVTGETNKKVRPMMENLSTYTGFERLLMLQKMLCILSESSGLEALASPGFINSFKANQEERINKVFEHVMYHFKEKITLHDVASLACMSEIAFCRYFKSRTGKSFFIFLNDIRIGYACRLLLEGAQSIMEVCYDSGFNNLSHFNRQFKEHTNQTPQHYRELFKK